MARDSTYGKLLGAMKVPEWVFGGEYGDISNLLNNRDLLDERRAAQELANRDNEIDIEKKQRRAQLEEELRQRDIFGGNGDKPLTLGDMYGRVRDTATELGDYDEVLKMQEKIDAIERQQKADAQQAEYKDALIAAAGRRGTRSSKAKGYDMYDPVNRVFVPNVDPEEAGRLARDEGYIYSRDPEKKTKIEEIATEESRRRAGGSEPGFFDRLFGGGKPAEEAIQKQQDLTKDLKDKAPGAKASAKADAQVPPGYELRKDRAGNPVLVKLRKG